MPKRSLQHPRSTLHKARNLACVTIFGKRVYLGRSGSPESRAMYAQIVAAWLAVDRKLALAELMRLSEQALVLCDVSISG